MSDKPVVSVGDFLVYRGGEDFKLPSGNVLTVTGVSRQITRNSGKIISATPICKTEEHEVHEDYVGRLFVHIEPLIAKKEINPSFRDTSEVLMWVPMTQEFGSTIHNLLPNLIRGPYEATVFDGKGTQTSGKYPHGFDNGFYIVDAFVADTLPVGSRKYIRQVVFWVATGNQIKEGLNFYSPRTFVTPGNLLSFWQQAA